MLRGYKNVTTRWPPNLGRIIAGNFHIFIHLQYIVITIIIVNTLHACHDHTISLRSREMIKVAVK